MKINRFKVLIIVLSTALSWQLCSGGQSFTVYIDNQLTGSLFNQPIKVTYKSHGVDFSQIIYAGKTYTISTIENLDGRSTITIEGYGRIKQAIFGQTTVSKDFLVQEWNKLGKDALSPLTITVTAKLTATSRGIPYYEPILSYGSEIPENVQPLPKEQELHASELLTVFPAIKNYGLQDSIAIVPFLDLPRTDWKKELVAGGVLVRATTAEDVSRYILGLGEHYSADEVLIASQTAIHQWSRRPEDNYATDRSKTTIRRLISKASDILQAALTEKNVGSGGEPIERSTTSQESAPEQTTAISSTSPKTTEELAVPSDESSPST